MITTIPLPSLGELLFLRFLSAPGGNALAATWLCDGDLGGLWMSRSAWSLAALADAFSRAHGRQPIIAIPEYFCGGSLAPVRDSGARLCFYPVRDDDLRPDWAACDALPGSIDLFVLVHYFGWPNDGAGARAFCDRRGAWLVEDAAHVLAPVEGIGQWGDAVLYSPHKLLPAPDGAVLVARPGLHAVEHHLVEAVRALGWHHPHTGGWRLKRLAQRSVLGPWLQRRRPGGQPDFASDPPAGPVPRTPSPSPAGAALIGRSDLGLAARLRRDNAAMLWRAVAAAAPWVPLMRANDAVAPYRLALRCPDKATATQLYARLRAAALPVESWPDLPPEVGAGAARRLRDTVLFLPCHQGCDGAELARHYAAALGTQS